MRALHKCTVLIKVMREREEREREKEVNEGESWFSSVINSVKIDIVLVIMN